MIHKEINDIFEKILYENYENESKGRNVYIVDIFPKVIESSDKYGEFEEYLSEMENPLLNKFIYAMMKIYMYEYVRKGNIYS